MTLPPDDWPRSPSGRTPQWARHESLGQHAPDPRWQAQAEDWLSYQVPRRRRRRRGGRLAAFLALLLAGGIWWNASPDPRADVTALGDPATYLDLADRVEGLLGRASSGADVIVPGPGPVPITGSRAEGARGTPPIGLEESRTRLAAPVSVTSPSSAHAFAALQDDGVTPVAWSPCRPVHYVVNPNGAPAGFESTVDAAIAELSAVTGLAFIDAGTTSEDPAASRGAYLPDEYGSRWAPVLIAAADDDTVPFLEGDTAGVAYTYRVRGLSSGQWHLVSGSVYVDQEAFDFRSAGGDPSWLGILRHELGHLVGLNHLDDATQLMNPVTSTVRTYQRGDLTGLATLGKGSCAPDV